MPVFKIAYEDDHGFIHVCYETANHGSDAELFAKEDHFNIRKIISVDQVTPSE
jgi:hypothetical protein